MTVANIQPAFASNVAMALVPAMAPAAQAETLAWKALPIHPKLACLFLRGMSIRAAFGLAVEVVAACPPVLQAELDPLLDFIQVAATESAMAGVSALASSWQAVTGVMADQAVTTWYFELLG